MDTLNQSVSMVMSQTRGQTRNNSPSRYPKMTSGLGYLYVQLIWKTMLWTKYRRNWETFPSKVWKYLAITLLGTNISQGFSAWWYHLLETFTSFLNISGCQIDRVMAEDPHFGKSSVEIHVAWGWMIFFSSLMCVLFLFGEKMLLWTLE